MMNRQDTVQKDNQPSVIEDLAINNEQATEVKGGDRQAMLKMFTADYCGTG